jgi:hypothetical protein
VSEATLSPNRMRVAPTRVEPCCRRFGAPDTALLLAAAFIRARTVPLFVPLLIIVGTIVVGPVGGGSESRIPQVIGNLLLGGFGTIRLILLRQTDEEWERPGLATGGTAVATGAPAARPAGTSEGSSGAG